MKRVFISYSHHEQDRDLVRDLARHLRAAGFESWDDTDLPAGSDRKKVIGKRIRTADAFLLLLTPAALKSGWPMAELGITEGMERVIVPVSAGVTPAEVPAPLRDYEVAPFDRVDDAIKTLSEKLNG
jgi:hypothetical protein